MVRLRLPFRDERGSAPAEFVMVGALLTVLILSVMQLALALHIRNTVLDAAAEGARWGALADNTLTDGIERTEDLISAALGPGYAKGVSARYTDYLGHASATVTVRAPLPLLGLAGVDRGLVVVGHAAVESLDQG